MENNESQQEFLKDLDIKPEDNVLEQPLETPETESTEGGETPEETEFKAKNRRERRLLTQNQRLREEAIAANARIQGITEAQQFGKDTTEAEFLKAVEPIYGNNTPEKAAATELLKKALKGVYETAKKEAIEESLGKVAERETNETQAVAEEEDNLEDILETLEENHNVDLTSDSASRKGFLTLLERLSPKDTEGNIIEYADPEVTYELFERTKEKSSSRAKDLASRSMTHSGTSGGSKLETDSVERFLKDSGII